MTKRKLAVFIASTTTILSLICDTAMSALATNDGKPILVELFTSEGCSSCPPADRLAIKLQSQTKNGSPIIVLSEHVDYWNQLGWDDPYSSRVFTERQQALTKILGLANVFTPQIIVDGSVSAVGNDSRAVDSALARCSELPKADLTLAIDGKEPTAADPKITVSATCPRSFAGKAVQFYLAVTEDGLTSAVKTGENKGKILVHDGVVRSLQKIGQLILVDPNKPLHATTQIDIKPTWKKANLKVVVFLQDISKQTIIASSQKALP